MTDNSLREGMERLRDRAEAECDRIHREFARKNHREGDEFRAGVYRYIANELDALLSQHPVGDEDWTERELERTRRACADNPVLAEGIATALDRFDLAELERVRQSRAEHAERELDDLAAAGDHLAEEAATRRGSLSGACENWRYVRDKVAANGLIKQKTS